MEETHAARLKLARPEITVEVVLHPVALLTPAPTAAASMSVPCVSAIAYKECKLTSNQGNRHSQEEPHLAAPGGGPPGHIEAC